LWAPEVNSRGNRIFTRLYNYEVVIVNFLTYMPATNISFHDQVLSYFWALLIIILIDWEKTVQGGKSENIREKKGEKTG
jgi:hypothetical protein